MEITNEIVGESLNRVAVVRLSGRFDAHEVAAVRHTLTTLINDSMGKVVVNLSKVTFIDSSGLAALVQGMKHCREKGGDLHLCRLAQPTRIIFELTRLDKAFPIFEEEQQAILAFAP
jgi:anti-sigma B factor antagonist